jgi:hypothetical protein
MITVDLSRVEALALQVARASGKACETTWERSQSAVSLIVGAAATDAASVTITTIEPGTLFLEIPSGAQAEWLVKTEGDWSRIEERLQAIFQAVFMGSVVERVKHCVGGFTEVRATIGDATTGIRLVRRGRPLPCVGRVSTRRYGAYPDA